MENVSDDNHEHSSLEEGRRLEDKLAASVASETSEAAARPVFEAGPVIINYLSAEGFEIETDKQLGKTEAAETPLILDVDQRARLGAAYQGMERFTAIQEAQAAKRKWQQSVDELKDAEREVEVLRALGPLTHEGYIKEELLEYKRKGVEYTKEAFDKATEVRRKTALGGEMKFSGGVFLEFNRNLVHYSE